LSIGYANICSSVQDHRQNFQCLNYSIGFERTNKSNGINKKEAWSIWIKEVLKASGPEADVIRSTLLRSWSPEADVIRSIWRSSKVETLKIFKCYSNEDLITPIIAEDWKNKATTISNGFRDIGSLFFGERWKRTIVWSVQPLPPLLWFVSAIGQEQQLCLHQCSSRLGMDLKLILHRTITKSGIRSFVIWSSSKRLFLCACNSTTSLSQLYIKEWRVWEWQDSYNNLQVPKLCWNCSASKVHLEFLNNFHILEILES